MVAIPPADAIHVQADSKAMFTIMWLASAATETQAIAVRSGDTGIFKADASDYILLMMMMMMVVVMVILILRVITRLHRV